MKKKVIGFICAAGLILMAGCAGGAGGSSSAASSTAASSSAVSSAASSEAASTAPESTAAPKPETGGQTAGVGNPWIDCKTLEEAAGISGFPMEVPKKVGGHSITLIQAVNKNMMQVFYTDKPIEAEGVKRTIIRKGVGKEDISGDYNKYEKEEKVTVGNQTVVMKSSSGKVHNITWGIEGYSFAIMSDAGLNLAEVKTIIPVIK